MYEIGNGLPENLFNVCPVFFAWWVYDYIAQDYYRETDVRVPPLD